MRPSHEPAATLGSSQNSESSSTYPPLAPFSDNDSRMRHAIVNRSAAHLTYPVYLHRFGLHLGTGYTDVLNSKILRYPIPDTPNLFPTRFSRIPPTANTRQYRALPAIFIPSSVSRIPFVSRDNSSPIPIKIRISIPIPTIPGVVSISPLNIGMAARSSGLCWSQI